MKKKYFFLYFFPFSIDIYIGTQKKQQYVMERTTYKSERISTLKLTTKVGEHVIHEKSVKIMKPWDDCA